MAMGFSRPCSDNKVGEKISSELELQIIEERQFDF